MHISEICRKSAKFRFFGGKNEDRKKTAEISPFFRFLVDLGAVLGTGNWPKIGKNGARKNDRKKDRNERPEFWRRDRYGGLTVVTGEVRRGNPSGYGGIPARVRGNLNTPSTPMGYGEFKPLRETAAPRKGIMRMGGAMDC